MSETIFPPLENWEPTRQTLQWYSRGVSAIPRAHAVPHPKWWHASLKVLPDGLVTEKVNLSDGHNLWLKMDFQRHKTIIFAGAKGIAESVKELPFTEGLTSSQFANELQTVAADLGLSGPYESEKFENNAPREYDPEAAETYFTVLVNVDRIFKKHREYLDGEVSPVNLWPHNFDLSVEWFGTRIEVQEGVEYPSQLNLGFYPGNQNTAPYFYSNPWPFEGEILLGKPLPKGASWHTEGWEGTILPYEELADDDQSEDRLLSYAQEVFEICAPTLLAR